MMLLEPVLATITGMVFLYEYPEISFYIGAALIIGALFFITINANKT